MTRSPWVLSAEQEAARALMGANLREARARARIAEADLAARVPVPSPAPRARKAKPPLFTSLSAAGECLDFATAKRISKKSSPAWSPSPLDEGEEGEDDEDEDDDDQRDDDDDDDEEEDDQSEEEDEVPKKLKHTDSCYSRAHEFVLGVPSAREVLTRAAGLPPGLAAGIHDRDLPSVAMALMKKGARR